MQSVTMGSLPTSFLLGLGIKGTKEDKRVGRKGFGVFPPASLPAAWLWAGCHSKKGHRSTSCGCLSGF